MNTFWLKIAAVVVIVLAVVIAVSRYTGSKPGGSHAVITVEDEPQAEKPKTFGDVAARDDKRLRAEPNQTVQMQFKELTEEQKVNAEQLYEMAIAQRKMGRLPGMSYSQMVQYCRQIIERYPESEYAYKSRKMLGEVPQREWERYKITQQEIDGTVTVPSK